MKYLSVCSGIEAATVAWHPLGWQPQAFAEISAFPSKVLAHHYPTVPNVGDFTSYRDTTAIDLLVGGTPCQSFSVAGLRGGMADSRGNLALEFMRLADRLRARWIVWENVPGVLSSNGGRDFGSVLGALVKLGYGFAYRVLDAQFFGVAQRRRRVFVVAHLGDWRRAAAVLFERESLRGDPSKGRKARANVAAGSVVSVGGSIAHTLRGEGFDASEDGTGRGTPIIAFDTTQVTSGENRSNPQPIAFSHRASKPTAGPLCPTLTVGHEGAGVLASTLSAHHGRNDAETTHIPAAGRARRLTPRECERLQGFPDDYTLIPGASDSARYKALGNSMAVPCMRWIGSRIAAVEVIPNE